MAAASTAFEVNFADFSSMCSSSARSHGNAGSSKDEDEEEGNDEEVRELEMCPVLEAGVGLSELVARMRVTEAQAEAIERYEQGTTEWLLSRRGTQTRLKDGRFYSETVPKPLRFLPGRLTASNFGTAVGHNKYSGADKLIEDMLWGVVVSNDAMRYGSEMEPVACDVFETALFFLTGGAMHVEHRGLMLACPELYDNTSATYEGWCGTSPDGIIHWKQGKGGESGSGSESPNGGSESGSPDGGRGSGSGSGGESQSQSPNGSGLCGGSGSLARPWMHPPGSRSLLEIKCPSVNKRNFYSERYGNERFGIPHYYYDQIMGICGLQHLGDAFFVVHLPDRTQVLRFAFDASYFAELFKGMRRFWFEEYLPAALACAHGKLVKGEIHVRDEHKEFEAPDMELEEEEVARAMAEAKSE